MSYSDQLACLYLHGFLSSPQSEKARELNAFYQHFIHPQQLCMPELPFEPEHAINKAIDCLAALAQQYPHVYIIGSSLGGFYATYLSQRFNLPAVLINPAVNPHGLFRHYIGPNTHYYTGEVHTLTADHLNQLAELSVNRIEYPNNLYLLLQTQDETLNYRHAAALYRDCRGWLEYGGNHRFNGFKERIPSMVHFAERWSRGA